MKKTTFVILVVLGLFSLGIFQPVDVDAQVPGRYIGNALPPQKSFTVGAATAYVTPVTRTYQLTANKTRVLGIQIYGPTTYSKVLIADQVFSGTNTLPSDKEHVSGVAQAAVVVEATPVFVWNGSTYEPPMRFIDFPRPIDIRDGLIISVVNAWVQLWYIDDKHGNENR